jgi:flagellar hook assembly protein FlgD
LYQNYPNPFNPVTQIDFMVAGDGWIEVAVFDVLGRKISTLQNGYCPAGTHAVTWDGTDDNGRPVASGIYLTRVSSRTQSAARKMVLLK